MSGRKGMHKGPMGLLSEEKIAQICRALRGGCYMETAAAHAGVSDRTLRRWLRKGRDEQERIAAGEEPREGFDLYVRLVEELDQALAAAEIAAVLQIARKAETTWQAAAWLLERRWPQRWAKAERQLADKPVQVIELRLVDGLDDEASESSD